MGAVIVIHDFFAWNDFLAHELLLFAAIWFFLGALDDLAVDVIWLWHCTKTTLQSWKVGSVGRKTVFGNIDTSGLAVFVPAWREANVIGHMLRHCTAAWPDDRIRIYVGCYPNDPATIAEVRSAAEQDERVHLVINPHPGPTSKADCLNTLWTTIGSDEIAGYPQARAVILQDAEDVVHKDALRVFAQHLETHDFVQIPVVPLVNPHSRWISGHYCDEFAESHGKAMVVRGVVAAGLPAAGVGCAFSHAAMLAVAGENGRLGIAAMPFDADSLTEDYELGLRVKDMGGAGIFVRARDEDGELVATAEFFPGDIGAAARQKSRWMAGIALLGWERMGWQGNLAENWMRLRDRRAVLAALVLCAAYLGLILLAVALIGKWFTDFRPAALDPVFRLLLICNFVMVIWRLGFRFGFTARQYGWREGCYALPRMIVANIISIMAARRALAGYLGELKGRKLRWEKTSHVILPSSELTEAKP